MAGKRKQQSEHDVSEATSKLSRLLETENELDALLEEARREARKLVEAAQQLANDRIEEFDSQLKEENRELRERVARDRDQTIDGIENEARQEAKRLDELDDAKITLLANHVVDLLVGRPDSRGRR
jgi:vacuolar-type H+-ATPase subunit H